VFTRTFWKDTAERVIATAAGGMLTVIGLNAFDVLHADWKALLGFGLGTGLVSFLTAIVASEVNDPESASLVDLDLPGRHAAPEDAAPAVVVHDSGDDD
jgi:hypothetical protein